MFFTLFFSLKIVLKFGCVIKIRKYKKNHGFKKLQNKKKYFKLNGLKINISRIGKYFFKNSALKNYEFKKIYQLQKI